MGMTIARGGLADHAEYVSHPGVHDINTPGMAESFTGEHPRTQLKQLLGGSDLTSSDH